MAFPNEEFFPYIDAYSENSQSSIFRCGLDNNNVPISGRRRLHPEWDRTINCNDGYRHGLRCYYDCDPSPLPPPGTANNAYIGYNLKVTPDLVQEEVIL